MSGMKVSFLQTPRPLSFGCNSKPAYRLDAPATGPIQSPLDTTFRPPEDEFTRRGPGGNLNFLI